MTDQLKTNSTSRPGERRTPDVHFWVNRPLGFTRRVRQGSQPTVQHATATSQR